jgi:hypothetical protein
MTVAQMTPLAGKSTNTGQQTACFAACLLFSQGFLRGVALNHPQQRPALLAALACVCTRSSAR